MRNAHPTEHPSVERDGHGPGDSGPCPICKEEMTAKEYYNPVSDIFPVPTTSKGRYWHMRHEHGILEHYRQPKAV